MGHTTTPGPSPDAAQAGTSNGVSGQRTNGSGDEARRQAVQRAEELVDRWGEQVGRCVSSLGHGILKWVARAREEAEDVWAEAQVIRQRQRSAKDPSEGAPPVNG